ncbi:MAG: tetratricopeptide repeat protein [Chthoniobacteraceae bacterium]
MKRTAAAILALLQTAALYAQAEPKQKAVPAKPAFPTATPPPALSQERETAQLLYETAVKEFAAGSLDAAQAGFQKVLALSPDNPPALINLALIAQRQRRPDDADKLLRKVIQKDMSNATAWLLLGIGAYERNELDAALAHLAQAVLYAPQDARAHQYLGATLGRRGWYSAGEDELRRALELDPKSADAHYNLAVIYMERVPAAVELARRHYFRALDLGAPPDEKLAGRIGK